MSRSLGLIEQAYSEHGDGLVVANSLGKDSAAVGQGEPERADPGRSIENQLGINLDCGGGRSSDLVLHTASDRRDRSEAKSPTDPRLVVELAAVAVVPD